MKRSMNRGGEKDKRLHIFICVQRFSLILIITLRLITTHIWTSFNAKCDYPILVLLIN